MSLEDTQSFPKGSYANNEEQEATLSLCGHHSPTAPLGPWLLRLLKKPVGPHNSFFYQCPLLTSPGEEHGTTLGIDTKDPCPEDLCPG